ncbi:hypothetical protein B0J17DRAFT_634087 [Rhizoctonia solani]|nr:hypothetical protein B0J17DRAFT_634087 [Rhizoctonia solani]
MSGVSAKQVPNIIGICAHAFGVDPTPLPDPRSVGQFILKELLLPRFKSEILCQTPKCESNSSVMPCSSDLAQKLYGVNGDHASDQLKVAQLEREWKIDSWVTHLGKSALLSLEESGSKALSDSIWESVKASAGGSELFSALTTAEQEDSLALELQKRVWDMGNTSFNQPPPILKQDMSCLLCGGCCAHKDMNASKGGSKAMLAFWKANQHLTPPVKLFNKDNDATITLAGPSIKPSEAEQQAYNMAESGAIKLCSLAGAAYNHKDDKKGHQDSHSYWFAEKHNRFRCFPDTSNVRYRSYINAAAELFTFHGAYIDYMEHTKKTKATRLRNHLELNILKALNCPATHSKLMVILIYVLAPNAPAPLATLDSSEWENSNVLAALQDHESALLFLTELFVAFCQGALQTWARFTEEFSPNGAIALLMPEQGGKAFMPTTNDANEGALGTWHVWTRRFPSLALHWFNAIAMNPANQTKAYIENNFTLSQHTWLRAEARRIDLSKLEAKQRSTIVTAQIEEGAKNKITLVHCGEQRHKREEYMAGIKLVLNPTKIQKLKGAELNDQIKLDAMYRIQHFKQLPLPGLAHNYIESRFPDKKHMGLLSPSSRELHGSGFAGKTTVFTTVESGLIWKTNQDHWKLHHGKYMINCGNCGVGHHTDSSGIFQGPAQVGAIMCPKPKHT